jgi:hypothetical protein
MNIQQGQLLNMTLLSLNTFKFYYTETELDEDSESDLIDFFDKFMFLFGMPLNPLVCRFCKLEFDKYIANESEDLEFLSSILGIIKDYEANPVDTCDCIKIILNKVKEDEEYLF